MVWDFFWRFLFSKRAGSVVRKISWLSFIALTVAIASLIVVLSVMKALNTNIQTRLLAVEPHLVLEFGQPEEALSPQKIQALYEKVRGQAQFPPVWKVFPFEIQDVILRTVEGRFRGGVARGMTAEALDFMLSEIKRIRKIQESAGPLEVSEVKEGEVLGERARIEAGEILVGVDLAHALGLFEGDALTVVAPEGLLLPAGEAPKFERVQVREILSTHLQDIDAEGLFYLQEKSLGAFRNSASLRRGFQIWLPAGTDADKTAEQMRQKLAPLPVQVSTWQDRNAALFLSLKLEKLVIGLFLSIAALVAGFSLLTVMGLLISQKRREIGLLQAIGMSRKEVFFLFQGLGVRLSGIGLILGAVIGLAISIYMELYPLQVLPDIYYDADVPAEVDPGFVLFVVSLGFLLSYIGGLMVTRPLARFEPTELLRK